MIDPGIILTLLSTLTGGGGLAVILQRRHNRKMRELEARLAEANVDKARVEGKADEWQIWKEQLEAEREHVRFKDERIDELLRINREKEERYARESKEKEERFREQTLFLRGVQRDLVAANQRELSLTKQIAELTIDRDHYFNWRCFREDDGTCEGCDRRRPKQPVPIKYIPLHDGEADPRPSHPVLPPGACE